MRSKPRITKKTEAKSGRHGTKPQTTASGAPCSPQERTPIVQGRSSDSSLEAAPSRSRKTSGSRMPQRNALAGRTHSSGNCCRFARHSLLIPLTGKPLRCKDRHSARNIRTPRRFISPKPSDRAKRPIRSASRPRRAECGVLARALYFLRQLRISNRSEVSSFI